MGLIKDIYNRYSMAPGIVGADVRWDTGTTKKTSRALWKSTKLRKSRACDICRDLLEAGYCAWRPLTDAGYRSARLCSGCFGVPL